MQTIPIEFVLSQTTMSLPELPLGLSLGLIRVAEVVDIAKVRASEADLSDPVVELAGLTRAELPAVREILDRVSAPDDVDAVRAKWLWLALSWAVEQKSSTEDLLREVDEIYELFNYPEQMQDFGPYAPVYQGKVDANAVSAEVRARLEQFLDEGRARFAKKPEELDRLPATLTAPR